MKFLYWTLVSLAIVVLGAVAMRLELVRAFYLVLGFVVGCSFVVALITITFNKVRK